jgi:hypothetical protein
MGQFHVSRDGSQFGPYDEAQSRSLFAQGNIAATDLVWCEGMSAWQSAAEVFGVASATNGPAAPPMPPPTRSAMTPNHAAGPHASHPTMATNQQIPLPPKLHWGLVLLFNVLTLGIFVCVWMFIQSSWIRRIDPKSNATMISAGYLGLTILAGVAGFVWGQGLATLLRLAAGGVVIYGSFSMRRSMVEYFNTVDPIGLRMSGVMTFFFNILYCQHHMTRIAEWKITDVLRPQ